VRDEEPVERVSMQERELADPEPVVDGDRERRESLLAKLIDEIEKRLRC
jgi:hypothetical protein